MQKTPFPLDAPLSASEMEQRIRTYNSQLNAVRFHKKPDDNKSIRVLVKDNIGVEDWPTSAGSFALKNLRLPDAFCIKQLKKNPNVDIFGKTHLTELAGFVTAKALTFGYSELGGRGVNPHGPQFPCAGSSSGSAIAVAAGFCDAALGTETRGSIMVPALRNGVFALKPTRGSVSRTGIVPLSSSLDAPGVLARNPNLLKDVFLSMVGQDPEDSLSFEFEVGNTPAKLSRRIVFCVERNSGDFSILQGRLKNFFSRLRQKGFEIYFVNRPYFPNDYKTISSQEIRRDLTKFLMKYAGEEEPHTFADLAFCYQSRKESHPFGMERILDALEMKPMSDVALKKLVEKNKTEANNLIEGILNTYNASFLGFIDYVDWFAIGGGPTAVMPVDFDSEIPLSILFASRRGMDLQLLDLMEELNS